MQLAVVERTAKTAKAVEAPFHNVILARVSSRLSPEQALGYHAFMLDRERGAGRSGCTIAKLGQPSHRGTAGGVNLWWNQHQQNFDSIRGKLREHERRVLSIILSCVDHNADPDIADLGRQLTGYVDPKRAGAAFVALVQALGSTLAELYRIRAP